MKAFPGNRFEGMELRDYFAAKAMNAFLVEVGVRVDQNYLDEIAVRAYNMADLMMKARVKE
jgi:hypothetical protein